MPCGPPDRGSTLPFPRCSPPPSAHRSGRLPSGGVGPGPCGARGRAGPAGDAAGRDAGGRAVTRRGTWARPAADWTARGDPAVSRDEIGSSGRMCPRAGFVRGAACRSFNNGRRERPGAGSELRPADCLQHERGRRPPPAGGAGAVRASVPGKGGRHETGRPGLGAGH